LKRRLRGIRKIERQAGKPAEPEEDDEEVEIVQGSCAAVRAAWTGDGLPPLAASGLKQHDRLSQIAGGLDRAAALAGSPPKIPLRDPNTLAETAFRWQGGERKRPPGGATVQPRGNALGSRAAGWL